MTEFSKEFILKTAYLAHLALVDTSTEIKYDERIDIVRRALSRTFKTAFNDSFYLATSVAAEKAAQIALEELPI